MSLLRGRISDFAGIINSASSPRNPRAAEREGRPSHGDVTQVSSFDILSSMPPGFQRGVPIVNGDDANRRTGPRRNAVCLYVHSAATRVRCK